MTSHLHKGLQFKIAFHLFHQILCQKHNVFVSQVVVGISFGRKVIIKDLEIWGRDTP